MLVFKIIQLILTSLCITVVSFVFLMPVLRARKCGRYYRQFNRFKEDSLNTPFGGGLCSLMGLLFGGLFSTLFLKSDYSIFILLIGFFTLCGAFTDIRQDNFSTVYHQNPLKKFAVIFLIFFAFLIWVWKLKITSVFSDNCKIYIQIPVMALLLSVIFCMTECSVQFGYDKNSISDGLSPAVLTICSLLLLVGFLKQDDEYSAFFTALICGCGMGTIVFDLKPSQFKWGRSGSGFCGACVCCFALICRFSPYVLLALLPLFIDSIAFILDFVFFRITKKVLFKGHFLKTHLRHKNSGEYKIIIIYAVSALLLGIVNILKGGV